MAASTVLDTTFPFNLLCTDSFCWMYLKNSLPHLVDVFAIYAGSSHPFEFCSMVSHLNPTVCRRSSFLSILLFTIVCQRQQSKASGKKGIANWFWSLYLINGWQQWNSLFPSPKETSWTHSTAERWNSSTMGEEYNGIGNDDADAGTEKKNENGYNEVKWKMYKHVVCMCVPERERRTTTTAPTDALRFSSPEKLLRVNFN